MNSQLADAVRLTKQYSSYFNFPLTTTNLHYWLISPQKYSLDLVSKYHTQKLSKSQISHIKIARELSFQKYKKALPFVKAIRHLISIKMVAITGSVAINSAKSSDDIDIFIVTSPNTLWLTRIIIYLIASLFFKRRKVRTTPSQFKDSLCFNLWLEEGSLKVPKSKRNLYTAHEVLQIMPIFDRNNTYHQFIIKNSWTKRYLANAYSSLINKTHPKSTNINLGIFPFNYLVQFLNKLAFQLQFHYMRSKITNEYVTLHSAYFHPKDYSRDISKKVV